MSLVKLITLREKVRSLAQLGKILIFNNFNSPATCEAENIIKLIDGGMSMCRINFSHGNSKSNARLIRKYQEAKRLRPHKLCGLMMELRGREIRLSEVSDKEKGV